MTKRLLILGYGGHGRVVADVARLCGYSEIGFLDDAHASGRKQQDLLLGSFATLDSLRPAWPIAIAAIGNNKLRLSLFEQLQRSGFETPSIVHPSAVISSGADIGDGVFVGPGVIINIGVRIEEAAIVNTRASIDHDCLIGAGSHIAPGATLSGNVAVGRRSWLGTGCSVRQGIDIGDDVLVGVGAAVVSNLAADRSYVGVPAKPLAQKTKPVSR